MAKDPEMLDLLAAAHLTRVLIGIESLNQKALDAIHKGQSVDDIRAAGEACREHGIRVIASIVLGLDDDTPEDIRRSIAFAKEIDAYQLQPAILTPYPGTPVYEQLEKTGRMLGSSWSDYDMMNVTFQPRNMSPWDLQELFYESVQYFYDFQSAKRIGELFGEEYEKRRKSLARSARMGTWAAHAAARIKGTSYYRIKHTPWLYAAAEG